MQDLFQRVSQGFGRCGEWGEIAQGTYCVSEVHSPVQRMGELQGKVRDGKVR